MAIGAISALFFISINYITNRKFLTPIMIFNVEWLVVFLINGFNYFDFYQFGNRSVVLVTLGLIVFNITYLTCQYFDTATLSYRKATATPSSEAIYSREKINTTQLVILQCIVTFFIAIIFIRMFPYLRNEGILAVRTIYTSNINFMTTFERYFYIHFVIFPLNTCLLLLSIILWFNDAIKFRHTILTFINTLLIGMITGGRMALFNLGIYLILAYVLCRRNTSQQAYKAKRRVLWLLISFIVIYIIMNTVLRPSSGNGSFLDSMILYFTGGMKLFDVAVQNPNSFGLNNYMYGSCFLGGLLSFAFTFLQYVPIVGSLFTTMPTTLAQAYLNQNVSISSTKSMNAFGTMYYYFMRDWGVVGVVALTAIFSASCYWIFKKLRSKNSSQNIYFAITLLIAIIYSPCWWDPYRMEFWTPMLHFLWVFPIIKTRGSVNSRCSFEED